MSYEDRALTLLSRWLGGENLREAARELASLAREEVEKSYEEGYEFAKEESRLVNEASEVLGK